jgi:hypothetical protein
MQSVGCLISALIAVANEPLEICMLTLVLKHIANITTYCLIKTVTCIPIASQQVCKHIPAAHAHATIGHPLLGNGHASLKTEDGVFRGVPAEGF